MQRRHCLQAQTRPQPLPQRHELSLVAGQTGVASASAAVHLVCAALLTQGARHLTPMLM